MRMKSGNRLTVVSTERFVHILHCVFADWIRDDECGIVAVASQQKTNGDRTAG